MVALTSKMQRNAGKPQGANVDSSVLPFPTATSTPDWLAAISVCAVIYCLVGEELVLEACNQAFADKHLEGARKWLADRGGDRLELYQEMVDFARSGDASRSLEVLRDGPFGPQYSTCSFGHLAPRADGAPRILVTLIDRTSERRIEKSLRRELVSDSLTGLPNRTGFDEDIDSRLNDPSLEPVSQYAVLALDVARFSRINESLGAVAGDELIITVARRLKSSLRQGDILARLGGNEFGVFARLNNGLSDALHIVQRIHAALAAPCRLSDLQISIDVAIGCALSREGEEPEDILRQAQAAMKLAKKSGKLEIYRPGVLRAARNRFDMESNLREALAQGSLKLAFHPLIDLQSGTVMGFEALARWPDKENRQVSPSEFIPVAEESGLINPLGRWAMYEAAQTLAKWDRQFGGQVPLGMNVNLSPIQMGRDDVPQVVAEALRYSGISGDRLTMELTESAIIADPDKARQVLTALKGLDVSVAMDDFGTGFSNLASLQRLPIDILKIDRSFVSEMLRDKDKCAIVRAILSLAKSLNIKTTAEGIESAALERALARYGCLHGQGFYYAQPMPEQEAYEFWLSRSS